MRWLFVVLLIAVSWLSSRAVAAQPDAVRPQAVKPRHSKAPAAEAEQLIRIAERARRLGRYGFAAQALKQAYKAQPRASLLLAIAEAYQQRFKAKRRAYDRVQALVYFQRYLAEQPQGSKAERAKKAAAELEAIEMPDDRRALDRAAAKERALARLAVTSPVLAAEVRIDGGKKRLLPLLTTIAPGEHTIKLSAGGYELAERRVTAVRGYVAVVDVTLKPEAAKLAVNTSSGASVYLDGRFLGVAPFKEPLAVEPGSRSLLVAMNGHRPVRKRLSLKRGKEREVEIDLPLTKRRIGASVVIALGASSVAAGVISGAIAVFSDNQLPESTDTSALLSRRDVARGVSAMASGIGFGLSLSGGIMWVFDEPKITVSPQGPGQAGATLTTRF